MTVEDLIKFLKKQPKDMEVAYRIHSEQCLMDEDDICIEELCSARPDGWLQNKRPDMPHKKYLLFPGN